MWLLRRRCAPEEYLSRRPASVEVVAASATVVWKPCALSAACVVVADSRFACVAVCLCVFICGSAGGWFLLALLRNVPVVAEACFTCTMVGTMAIARGGDRRVVAVAEADRCAAGA